MNWIQVQINNSLAATSKESKLYINPIELELIDKVISKCYELHSSNPTIPLGILLAAGFDLIISADYYSTVAHRGWFYCPDPTPNLYFHFTNCCPRHALENIFHFNRSSKPSSGNIGKSTSRILRNFISNIFQRNGLNEVVLKGVEPIDVVILNENTKHVFFGEIKASPLLTLPLVMPSDPIFDNHSNQLTLNSVFGVNIKIFLPIEINEKWHEKVYDFGVKESADDNYWGFRSMLRLIDDNEFFIQYCNFWNTALKFYHPRYTQSLFWLTNACGAPSPMPAGWSRGKGGEGSSYESISDSKTSVGMDRTDDIKKGIYQVLKIGSEGKPINSEWFLKVGILSNIHAARHFNDYLGSLKNMIWTYDYTGAATKAGDLSPDHSLYNLFDGIIALTESYYRDDWLKQIFSFSVE